MKQVIMLTIVGLLFTPANAYAVENTDGSINFNEINTHVVGGVNSKSLELPWQVYLVINKNGSNYSCGGTLITDLWVVSAAHCLLDSASSMVNPSQIKVYSGGIDKSVSGDMSINTVSNVIVHPNYSATDNTEDLALVMLATAVKLPAQAIKMMDDSTQVDADIEFGSALESNLILSGWGRTSTNGIESTTILQKAAVSGVSDRDCELNWGWSGYEENFICANAFNRGSCSGDSGGPLIWQDKDAINDNDLGYRLAGIVSFGNTRQCALNSLPDVYTQVNTYSAWIIEEINKISSYQEPESSFTQDIFDMSNNQGLSGSKGGGLDYSFIVAVSCLLLFRRRANKQNNS